MISLLCISSLIILPAIGWFLLNYVSVARFSRVVIWGTLVFIVHNLLFITGYSLRGDNIDYVIFSLEYPFFLLIAISLIKVRRNVYTKILKGLGLAVMVLGIIWGGINSVLFIAVDMDYVSDKNISFTASNGKLYELRRYSFGFVTLENTRYTFDTYRTFEYLPIEHLTDRTVLWDNKVGFNISDDLQFDIRSKKGTDTLVIKSKGADVWKKKVN